jgi:hypothetical protein
MLMNPKGGQWLEKEAKAVEMTRFFHVKEVKEQARIIGAGA